MRAIVVITLILGSTAAAQPSDTEAREHFRRGTRSYNLGEFAAAVREFRRAYELSEAPGLLFNLAQAARLNRQPERALLYYESYLKLHPRAANRDDVERLMILCARAVGSSLRETETLTMREPPPPPPAPPEEPPPLAPPPPAIVERPPPRPRRGLEIAGISIASVGASALVGALALGLLADAAADDLSQSRGSWDASHRALYQRGEREAAASTGLYAAGGVALATGVIMAIVGSRKVRPRLTAAAGAGLACAF